MRLRRRKTEDRKQKTEGRRQWQEAEAGGSGRREIEERQVKDEQVVDLYKS